ncbi:MAG: Gfo/Idh/MocA family oxidoreductase [Clostridia bacterium]|nr:Gfo/Idh/MocA family oxidoreductase [Clostridia bacterium]
MDTQVRFGLIGCGRISWNHLDGIKNAPHAKLVAVCDIDAAKAEKAAKIGGLDKYYTDIDEMMKHETLDVVCILTPSGMHSEHAIKVANYKVNVLCEKPLCTTREKMERMIEVCHQNGVKLGAIYQRRTFSAAIETKKAVEEGRLGKITLASAELKYYRDQAYYDSGDWRGTWEMDGGGALMNQGVHGVDMLDYMMGGIESVYAKCERMVWRTEVEDTAAALLQFKNGAIGVLQGATTVYPGLDTIFHVDGSEGTLSFGDTGFYRWQMKDPDFKKPETFGSLGGLNCQYNANNIGHTVQIEDMANAVLEDRDPMVTGEAAMHSVGIILSIYESAKTGKEVLVK